MTTLTITPDIAKKRMKLAGRIAAGEKVAVTVKGFGSRPTATTRLRVLFAHNIIAQFPLPPAEGEQIVGWTVSGEDLTAVLNLNTVQAEKFARVHAVNCLFILDDVSDGVRQLYATEDMEILRWLKTPDTDVPVNLDDFPKMLEEVRAEINDFKSEMANRANEYETSLSSAWNTYRNSLNGAIQQFTSTVMSAVNDKADAQTVNSHVQRSDNPHNVTKSQVGLGNVDNTSDMSKPVSNLQRQAIETAVSGVRQAVNFEATRADGREREIANSVDAERRRASAEEEKLDLAIRTEKDERDGDVAALRTDLDTKQDNLYTLGEQSAWSFSTESTGSEIEAFMAAAGNYSVSESAAGGGWMYSVTGYDTSVYYVATVVRTRKSATVDFYVFDQTETELYGQIRATYAAVHTNIPAQVDTTPVHDSGRLVTSGGIWSALWGSLTALLPGISSLYDWCVAQLAGKADKSDLALRPTMFGIGGGVWVFANEGEGFIVVNSEVTSLPASKTSIGYDEYADNHSLSAVYAPNVLTVGKGAFTLCTALTTISLPAATSIGEPAFDFCTALTTLDLSSFAKAQILANASTWGINPTSGHSITVTASDETFTITGE